MFSSGAATLDHLGWVERTVGLRAKRFSATYAQPYLECQYDEISHLFRRTTVKSQTQDVCHISGAAVLSLSHHIPRLGYRRTQVPRLLVIANMQCSVQPSGGWDPFRQPRTCSRISVLSETPQNAERNHRWTGDSLMSIDGCRGGAQVSNCEAAGDCCQLLSEISCPSLSWQTFVAAPHFGSTERTCLLRPVYRTSLTRKDRKSGEKPMCVGDNDGSCKNCVLLWKEEGPAQTVQALAPQLGRGAIRPGESRQELQGQSEEGGPERESVDGRFYKHLVVFEAIKSIPLDVSTPSRLHASTHDWGVPPLISK